MEQPETSEHMRCNSHDRPAFGFATASSRDVSFVESLGADTVIDYRTARFEDVVPQVDIVLDMVGGDTRERSFQVTKPDGILVSVASNAPPASNLPASMRSVFFLVGVITQRLEKLTDLFDGGQLKARLGTVLALDRAREAHEMLGGAPHRSGKIVLEVAKLA